MEASELWGGGNFILGPMVRASSLPLRLAALHYGADVVYSEEIPAHRASQSLCMRFDNPALGTVDFIEKKKDGYNTLVLFRTDKRREVECKKCVLQLGCNDSVTALKAAQLFEADVAAIDINMGCSKHYSTSRGMGSALMTKPEIAEDIIKTLRRNLSIPVSVKTRLQGTQDCCSTNNSIVDVKKTMEWLNQLQSCGAQCVTMHMRIPSEKYRDKTHIDVFSILHRHMRNSNIPLVYNGDIWSCRDVEAVRSSVRADCTYYITDSSTSSTTGSTATTLQCCCYCSKTATTTSTDSDETHPIESTQACTCTRREDDAVSFMLSRAGLWNPSVFQQFRPRCAENGSISTPSVANYSSSNAASSSDSSITDVMGCIIKHSIATANCPLNTRYLLQHILAGSKQLHTPVRDNITRYYDLRGVADSMGYGEYASEQYTLQEQAWAGVLDKPYCTSSGSSSNNSNNYSLTTDHSTTTNTTTTTSSSIASTTTYSSTTSIGKYLNSATWPGIIGQTSHEYSDRYFDDNYYIAFNKPPPSTTTVGTTSSGSSSSTDDNSINTNSCSNSTNTKRPFIYAGFTESNSTVVRVKKKL